MKVKSRNMIEVALQIVFLLCLILQITQWFVSLIDYLFGFIAIAILVLFILQAMSKGKKSNQLYVAFLPIIEIALFFGTTVLAHRIDALLFPESISIGSCILLYFTLIVLLLLACIAIPTYFKANKLGIVEDQPATSNIPHVGNADELRKLKSLLDCGAITEEEFQAKRAELLK